MAVYSVIETLKTDTYVVGTNEIYQRIITRAATMAYNYINSYLDGIYSVPFDTGTSTPATIKDISDLLSRGIARALQLKQPIMLKDPKAADADVRTAIEWLADIVKGTASVVGVSRLTTNRGPSHNMDNYIPIFNVDSSLEHNPDRRLLEDIADDREDSN